MIRFNNLLSMVQTPETHGEYLLISLNTKNQKLGS